SGALLVGVLALLGWIALDVGVGLAMALAIVPMWLIAEWLAAHAGATTVWIAFTVLFVGGWVFQFVGHAYEGRRPALVDNLFQAFIGPMFLVAETLIALGLRADLRRAVAGPHIAERAAVTPK
ncbi:MAG: Mpo1-like protein, partial [Reyranellaceae bacterium]